MMSLTRLDLRRLVSGTVFAVLILPLAISAASASLLGWLAVLAGKGGDVLATAVDTVHRWANPDIYGSAPRRARKLFYSRRTVERLVSTIESQNRIINRMEGN